MANAVAARMHGDDYQALVFWKHACRLLREEDGIESIEIESDDLKSLDDVVINFKDGHLDSQGYPLKREGIQVKYHVDFRGCLNAGALIDPAFINATSVSFLQRAFNLWKEYGSEGLGFAFCSIWAIDHNDPLSELVSGDDGHILTEKLCNGGVRSKFGRVREKWRSHLNADVNQLLSFLKSVRVLVSTQKALLLEHVNNEFVLAGLCPIENDALINPYYELARTLIKGRSTRLKREDLLKMCKKSNLWKGRPLSLRPMKKVGVRSRLRGTEGFEEWTKTQLDLLSMFDERQLKEGYTWNHDILTPVETFLQAELRMGDSCEMWLPVHSTIAVAIGYILDAKSGVDVHMIQTTVSGTDTWCNKKSCSEDGGMGNDWVVGDVSVSAGSDLAIAISVVHDIQQDVCSYIHEAGLKVSALRNFCCIECGQRAIAGQEHAVALIEKVIDSARQFKQGASRTSILHIFFAMTNFTA